MNWRYIGFSTIFLCLHLLVWAIGATGTARAVYSSDTGVEILTAEDYMATGQPLPIRCLDPYSASLIPRVSFNVKSTLLSRRHKWNTKRSGEHQAPFLMWLQSIRGVGPKTAADLQKFISPDRAPLCPPYFDLYRGGN